ncbi:MAG: Hpt domain-containing protein [Pseudohongiellaceae bacterium]|nr:Hpt domain-containing protein [Pseudohongiellaceae bacterium]
MTAQELDLIDSNTLHRFGGSVKIFCRVQGRFLEEAQLIEGKIIKAHADNDSEQVWEQLHALKGMSGTIGAKALAQLAAQYEHQVKSSGTVSSLSCDDLQTLSELILSSNQALAKLAASLS